jgi:hypothetical protein
MYVFRRPWDRARRRRKLGLPTPSAIGVFVGAGINFAAGTLTQPRLGWGVISQSSGAFPGPYIFGAGIAASAQNFVPAQSATLSLTGVGSLFNAGNSSALWSSTGSIVGVGMPFGVGSFTVTHVP